MSQRYSAVCCQANNTTAGHRSEIGSANLDRVLGLVDYSALRLGFPDFAPVRLILFPEAFLQGWVRDGSPYSSIFLKVARDIAIQIPGRETDLLAEKARKYNVYIAGTAHEVMAEFGTDFALNCGFVIGPAGDLVLKYHKINPYMLKRSRDDVSPHDIFDRYVEVMDGKYGRKNSDLLSCFCPVVDTDIGKLGYIVCNDGFFMESSRALALQGCEVMLRSSGDIEPDGGPPQEAWEIENRAHAAFNTMYVVACATGFYSAPGFPMQLSRGNSMIVDYHGALLCHSDYGGETATFGVIDLDSLRSRRMDGRHNWVAQLRTEAYRHMYDHPLYPVNFFAGKDPGVVSQEDRYNAQPIKRLLAEGTWKSPEERSHG